MQNYVVMYKANVRSYPISTHVSYSHNTSSYGRVLSVYLACYEPQSFSETAIDPQWVEAMKLEIAALKENQTWSIVDLPLARH